MRTFKNWLVEEKSSSEYDNREPHHAYHTDDGHLIHVHLNKNPKGTHAVFINKSLGNQVTKVVHWNVGADQPSKYELERAGKEDNLQQESFHIGEGWLLERAPAKVKVEKPKKEVKHVIDGKMTPNTGGKVTELATMVHLIGHKHEHAGTFGSKEHEAEAKPYKDEIEHMVKGVKDPEEVQTRIEHGRAAANNILAHLKEKHGPNAKIVNVAHTAQPGDIPRFTRGLHNDDQESNPSDVAVEVAGSKKKASKKNSDGTHFEGYSLKSSKKANEITAKNPAIHMNGLLDHPSREFKAEKVSREGIKKHVLKPMNVDHLTQTQRAKVVDAEREKAAAAGNYDKQKGTQLEQDANVGGRKAINDVATELHSHLHHLINNVGDEGHRMIGKMMKNHLTSESSMPWSKVKVKGETKDKVKSTIAEGSESPMAKIFDHPNTKFTVHRKEGSNSVTIGYHHPETGEHVTLAHYTPKTKSNVFKSDVHGWNVRPAATH